MPALPPEMVTPEFTTKDGESNPTKHGPVLFTATVPAQTPALVPRATISSWFPIICPENVNRALLLVIFKPDEVMPAVSINTPAIVEPEEIP